MIYRAVYRSGTADGCLTIPVITLLQADEKKLAMGGALVEPLDSSLLIFRNISKEVGGVHVHGR